MVKNRRRKKKEKGKNKRRKEGTTSENNKKTGLAHNFILLACVNMTLSVLSTANSSA